MSRLKLDYTWGTKYIITISHILSLFCYKQVKTFKLKYKQKIKKYDFIIIIMVSFLINENIPGKLTQTYQMSIKQLSIIFYKQLFWQSFLSTYRQVSFLVCSLLYVENLSNKMEKLLRKSNLLLPNATFISKGHFLE